MKCSDLIFNSLERNFDLDVKTQSDFETIFVFRYQILESLSKTLEYQNIWTNFKKSYRQGSNSFVSFKLKA